MKIQIFSRKHPVDTNKELFTRKPTRRFYFRVIARNGQIVAQSEGYTTKQSAKKTIKSLKKSLRDASIEDLC